MKFIDHFAGMLDLTILQAQIMHQREDHVRIYDVSRGCYTSRYNLFPSDSHLLYFSENEEGDLLTIHARRRIDGMGLTEEELKILCNLYGYPPVEDPIYRGPIRGFDFMVPYEGLSLVLVPEV